MAAIIQKYEIVIAGKLSQTDSYTSIKNPFNGQAIAEVGVASNTHIDAAINAAATAFKTLRRTPTHERAKTLEGTAQRIQQGAEELARLIALEAGKPLRYARAEVQRAALTFTLGAAESRRLGGEVMPLDQLPGAEGRLCMYQRVAAGPIAAFAPFNFPLNLVAHKLSPAFALGAPVVLKPAPQSPLSALRLAQILFDAGLAPEFLSVLHAPPEVAERMVRDERMSALSFTGSAKVGFWLKSIAGKKRVLLELGGNAPCIVDAGTDLNLALPRIVEASFANAGQVCIKAQRIIVHHSLYDEFLERFVEQTRALVCGDPLNENTIVGPVIGPEHKERILSWVNQAVAAGATLHTGGAADGQIVLPTVLSNVDPQLPIYAEEVFGPVTLVDSFTHFEEAIHKANASRYGLQAGVFTADIGRALQAFNDLDYGGVLINDTPMFRMDNYPYGGIKDSGLGREGVAFAIQELSEIKLLSLRHLAEKPL